MTPLYPGYGTHFSYVYVGTPAQRQSVIIDTGKLFSWVDIMCIFRHGCMYMCLFVRLCLCTNTSIYIYTCMYVCTYLWACVCMYSFFGVRMYIHMYKNTYLNFYFVCRTRFFSCIWFGTRNTCTVLTTKKERNSLIFYLWNSRNSPYFGV